MSSPLAGIRKWLGVVALLCCTPALATTVYKTVDENGKVSFSDTPPAGDAAVETMQIDAPQPQDTELTRQRLEDMRETTDRMAADRMAREKHRAEMRQLAAEEAAQRSAARYSYPEYVDDATIISGYHNYPVRRNVNRRWWKNNRPRPEHPIARPGHPGKGHYLPGTRPPLRHSDPRFNIKQPGNNYPASLVRRHYQPAVRAQFR